MKVLSQWLRNNSLSLVFFCLFVLSLAGQSVSGFLSYNQQHLSHRKPTIGYVDYLGTGVFLDGIFVNWQAAMLQLFCLILFSEELRQKGASHSRKPDTSAKPSGNNDEGDRSWIYRNSFSLAFAILVCSSLIAHIFAGTWAYNETRALSNRPPLSTASYLATGDFWFKTFQTWEAEFIAIFVFLVLSIFLRQQGSAESKPVESSNEETGETNE